MYQGYVDERSTRHVAGWARDLGDPARRVPVEILLACPGGGTRLLATLVADAFSEVLLQVGVGDGRHGFRIEFAAPLTEAERDTLFARPAGSIQVLELAPGLKTLPPGEEPPHFQGYVDELSIGHAAGWLRDLNNPAARFEVEIITADGAVLATARAADFSPVLKEINVGDGSYAFACKFPRLLREAERDGAVVRPRGSTLALEFAPAVKRDLPLIAALDLDIEGMAPLVFAAALKLAPYMAAGGMRLRGSLRAALALLDGAAAEARRALSISLDLTQRMPPILLEWAAKSQVFALDIGVATLSPAVFATLNPQAGFTFFREQLAYIKDATTRAVPYFPTSTPRLRYTLPVLPENAEDLPATIAGLAAEFGATEITLARGPAISDAQWARARAAGWPEAAPAELSVSATGALSKSGARLGHLGEMQHPIENIVF